ncbi:MULTISPECIES: site-specific integrase [Vibrio]|uniref:site-specific integrase n=1 Tax=Vibrio TaxID=662 RepID=UPI002964DFE4|nr:site-specific integrase [Vibrio sp. 947]MDW1928726.1 site-specific integrase [Vibrio sp. 947]HCZ9307537.1 site-specific integrase [Vibrio alginolyticus]
MPSVFIEKVNSKKGVTKFKVRFRTQDGDPVKGQVTRTFCSLAKANAFKKRQVEQFTKGNFSIFFYTKKNTEKETVGTILIDYLVNKSTSDNIAPRSKPLLKRIATQSPIRDIPAENLAGHHWYDLARFMEQEWKIKPQTASNYLSTLKSALKRCKVVLNYKIELNGYSEGMSVARFDGYAAESEARTIRPTKSCLKNIEVALIKEKLSQRRKIPMLEIFKFALGSALRLSEICGKITWQDLDEEKRTLTIRKRKTPRQGKTITSCFELSKELFDILICQPRGKDTDPIFPYKPDSVGSAWRSLMKELNIEDLHFHDLRAEAICRLFEANLSLAEIAKISGHRDLNTLNNYYLRLLPTLPSKLAA